MFVLQPYQQASPVLSITPAYHAADLRAQPYRQCPVELWHIPLGDPGWFYPPETDALLNHHSED